MQTLNLWLKTWVFIAYKMVSKLNHIYFRNSWSLDFKIFEKFKLYLLSISFLSSNSKIVFLISYPCRTNKNYLDIKYQKYIKYFTLFLDMHCSFLLLINSNILNKLLHRLGASESMWVNSLPLGGLHLQYIQYNLWNDYYSVFRFTLLDNVTMPLGI